MSMNCSTCAYLNRLDMCARCVLSLDASLPPWEKSNKWKPKQEKQMKEYKPTSKCTLKNIMDIAYASNCSEVHKNVVDVLNAHMINDYDLPGRKQGIDAGSPFFVLMTDRPDKCKWLIKKGIIEEVNKLKPCPICTFEVEIIEDYKSGLFSIRCPCGLHTEGFSLHESVGKYWNKRR